MRPRILLAEGDPSLAVRLGEALRRGGFAPVVARSAAEALAVAERARPDLILVDEVSDSSRHELCAFLRRRSDAPIVMLAESVEHADRDAARDGVDDYVVKPFGTAAAVTRIRAVLHRTRRAAEAHRAVLHVGPLEVDTAMRRARFEGRDLRLSAKELALLTRLARDAGRVVSREQLMRDVWSDGDAERASRTLEVHIGTLRRKLDDERARVIHTVRGVGFRLASAEELAEAAV